MARITSIEPLIERIARGEECGPVYLLAGDAVLSGPAAERLASALASRSGTEVEVVRRPVSLAPVLDDLRTYSLFGQAKVVLVHETALFADRAAAADLLDETAEVLPLASEAGEELSGRERQAAARLVQVLNLFGVAVDRSAEAVLDQLPAWAFEGGKAYRKRRRSKRGKRQVEELRAGLLQLFEAAVEAGLVGWAENDLADLSTVLRQGLPEGHVLVLAESNVAADHPLVEQLKAAGRFVDVGRVEAAKRGGFEGLDALAEELERQTGRGVEPRALAELARRTLRKAGRGQWDRIDPESTARLAAEYRKLAMLLEAEGARIDVALVEEAVEDRGEEDVWALLDAVGEGRGREALDRLRRLLWAAEDPVAARLGLFNLIADFSRQLMATQALVRLHGVPAGERSFQRFKSRVAPKLQGPLPEGGESPVARMHPFRLFRVYSAASRLAGEDLSLLPWQVLQAELRLKGESGEGDAALGELLLTLAAGTAGGGRRGRA